MFRQAPMSIMNPGFRQDMLVTALCAASRAKCRFSGQKCLLWYRGTWSTNGSRSLQRIELKVWETPRNSQRLLWLAFVAQTKKSVMMIWNIPKYSQFLKECSIIFSQIFQNILTTKKIPRANVDLRKLWCMNNRCAKFERNPYVGKYLIPNANSTATFSCIFTSCNYWHAGKSCFKAPKAKHIVQKNCFDTTHLQFNPRW